MLGLALAIDYSLFMVSRFREELRRGRTSARPSTITVATSGKAVAFSGLAVAIGLSGLLLFEPTALRSFGIGGALIVAASVFFALTFLPAVLGMLGPRVNALSVAGLRDRIRRALGRPVGAAAEAARESRWERIAHWVMARPFAVLIPTLAFLLLLGTPFLRLEPGHPGRLHPAAGHREPRGVRRPADRVPGRRDLADRRPRHGRRVADRRGQHPARSSTSARPIDAVDGIDRVEGPFAGLKDPATGADLDAAGIAALFAAPRDQLPPELAAGLERLEDGLHPRLDRPPRRRSARSSPLSARPGPRSCRASAPSTVDGVDARRSAASPPRATTSWPASRRRSRTRSR